MVIINYSLIVFFEDFYDMLRKIKDLNVFRNYNSNILSVMYKFSSIVISLFFGCLIWTLKLIENKILYNFSTYNEKVQPIFYFFYLMILFLINIIIYPISIILNITGIIEEFIRGNYDIYI